MSASAGLAVIVTVSGSVPVTRSPVGGLPPVDARFTTEPALTSFCVTLYVAVAETCCPGASVPTAPGHVYVRADRPASGSLMVTPESVTLPMLEVTNV